MAEMTRTEARGILQQLVKQQQATVRLAAVIEADAALEAEVVDLRAEMDKLRSSISDTRKEATVSKAAMSDAAAAARRAWDASVSAQQELDATRKAVDAAKRQADVEIKHSAQAVETSRQAQLADVQRTVVARRDAADAEHAERLAAMRTELEALQERKETIAREVADMLDRFSAR